MTGSDEDPIRLVEDTATGDRFLIYSTQQGIQLDIRFEGETLWMTQAQIAELFGRDQSVISRHIAKVFEEGELKEESSMHKMHIATSTRPVTIYNLDMVISVGYRVSSTQATLFRKWATSILVQYARKGFVIDSPRLKERGNRDRLKELREIIRDIRSDEANLYAELQSICALCQDYDGKQETATHFFQYMQAKMVHAVVSMTPSEILKSRANHAEENMGLQTWKHENIRKADVTVSKNYLAEPEIKELNRLTDILLSLFEDQLEMGRLVVMDDAKKFLDQQLRQMGRAVLSSGGSVKRDHAIAHVESEYNKFKLAQKAEKKEIADDQVAEIIKAGKKLPK
ncbi:RhuM family protein [Celeribacter halophilus]|uniref:RhuM family protein n=1 Tax=Celeribacter halophilus TaxID=576117 RepID=UPI003A8D02A8